MLLGYFQLRLEVRNPVTLTAPPWDQTDVPDCPITNVFDFPQPFGCIFTHSVTHLTVKQAESLRHDVIPHLSLSVSVAIAGNIIGLSTNRIFIYNDDDERESAQMMLTVKSYCVAKRPRSCHPQALCSLCSCASLLFSFLFVSADNDSMVRHTAFTCSTQQGSILSRCRKCDLFDTCDVQCPPPPPRRFTNHGVGLFTTPAPQPPAQHKHFEFVRMRVLFCQETDPLNL